MLPLWSVAQHEDCRTAYVICSDSSFTFLPQGRGIDDFANPNNDQGCLFTRENISAWFYFELREDMPLDSNQLGFLLIDTVPGFFIDYDFAIYGPNLSCDSLGSPYRCSFAKLPNNGNLRGSVVTTGFNMNALDTTEQVSDVNADGFLKPMEVKPGDGFFLVIDFFVSAFPGGNLEDFDSTAIQGFKFEWGGTAAPWLNCIANPNCDQVTVDIANNQTLCAGESFNFNTVVTNTNGGESYIWSELNGRTDLLSDPNIANPQLDIPVGFSGILEYTLLVKEGACEHTDVITITVIDGGVPNIVGDSVVCEGDLAILTVQAGFDTYEWSNGATTRTISVPGGQTYRVTVTTNGPACPGVGEFSVREALPPTPFIRGLSNICQAGRSEALLRAPENYASYLWNDGTNTSADEFFTVSTVGMVSLTITDSLGCEFTAFTDVVLNPDPIPIIAGDGNLCIGTLDTISLANSDLNVTSWSGGRVLDAGQRMLEVNQAGTYTVQVEDTLLCLGTGDFIVTSRPNPNANIGGSPTFCSNAFTTLIAPPGLSYQWSTGETTQTVNADSVFTISLTVTDTFGCVDTEQVALDSLPIPKPQIAGLDYICEDGTTTLTSDPFDTYQWSTGAVTQSITVDTARSFQVTVVDGNGCQGSGTFLVDQRINPIPQITGDSLLCPGDVTTLLANTGFVSYNWSDGSNSISTTFDRAGSLTVSVVDSFGCPGMSSVQIDTLSAPVPQITGDTAFCEGTSGLLIGEPGFVSYEWPDGSTNTSFMVDSGGVVELIVIDNNGCEGSNIVDVNERVAPTPTIAGAANFCANESTSFTAEAGFVSYAWSSGEMGAQIQVSAPGAFTVTVVDDVGCEGTGQVLADTIPIPQPTINGGDYICETGTRLLFSDPFIAYEWSTGGTMGATLISSPGTYSLTVTAVTGCQASVEKEISLQPDPIPQIQGDNILCPTESTTLSTTEEFQFYEWSNGSFDPSIQTTFVPEVWVSVIDTFGCEGFDTLALMDVPNPIVSVAGQLDICDGEGAVLQATAGFPTYIWSNGSDSSSTLGTVDGLYTVTVTDINGCQSSADQTLRVNANPKPEITGDLQACANIGATLSVRQNFLSYQWSNGATTSFIDVNESGEYIVSVNSPGGCTNLDTVQVEIFDPRIAPINNAVLDVCQGETLDLNAGEGFLSYDWSTGQTTEQITVNMGGTFSVIVTDSNMCRTDATILVREQNLPVPNIIAPSVFCRGTPVSLLASGSFRSYNWSTGDRGDVLEINQGGRYDLTVTDNNGCSGSVFVDLAERDAPDIDIIGDVKICDGDTTTLSVPGNFLYYIWTNDSNDSSLVITEPGSYGVLVVAENGCTGSDEVQVLFRPDPLPLISGDLTLCSADIGMLDAGPGFVEYEWGNGDTTQQTTIDTGGVYEVRVVDDFGCENIARIPVVEVPSPVVDIIGPGGICPTDTVRLSVDSIFSTYAWSNGAQVPSINLFTAGTYSIEVRDANNCAAIDSITLNRFVDPDFNLMGDTVFCEGDNVRIALDRIFPDITWSTGSNATSIQVDTTGDYGVTVTNAEGCETFKSRFVMQNPAPPALPGPDTILNCYFPEIQIGLDSLAYPPNVALSWTGPGITAGNLNAYQPSVNVAGTYTLSTSNVLTGCVSAPNMVMVDDLRFSPAVQISSTGEVDCDNGRSSLTGLGSEVGPDIFYEWYLVEADSLFAIDQLDLIVSEPLTYKLVVTDRLTGCTNSDSLLLGFDPTLPTASIGPVDPINCARPTETLEADLGPIGANWNFSWIAEQNLADTILGTQFIATQEGEYILIVENRNNGCLSTDRVSVRRNDIVPDINAGPDVELDCNLPEIQLGAPFEQERWIINWTKAGDPSFITAQKRPIVTEAGVYQLEVLDPVNGCISYDTVEVNVYDNFPELVNFQVIPEECFGDNNGELNIFSVVGGEGPYLFGLGDQGLSLDSTRRNLASGLYVLNIEDIRGCELDTTFIIDQGTDPMLELGEDRFISQGEFVRLSALTNIDPVAIQDLRWTQPDTLACDTCMVQRLAPLETTEYIATVVDSNGCRATDSVNVYVDRTRGVYIPNAFSPNGDGYNDRITVFSSRNVRRVVRFLIFDRGGDQVFERKEFPTNDLSLGWDGFHRGRLMNSQTLAYFAEVEYEDGEVVLFEGSIHLVR